MDLLKGHVYGGRNGRYRKILNLTDSARIEAMNPSFVLWVRCKENGEVVGVGRENLWRIPRFSTWAKEHIGGSGETFIEQSSKDVLFSSTEQLFSFSKDKIVLATNLYDHFGKTRMAFYCFIPGIKEGFMALNIGEGRADHGFWNGLHKVVSILHRSYRNYGLELAVYQSALSLQGKGARDQVVGLLNEFKTYNHVPSDPFIKYLDLVNDIGIIDKIMPGELKGYSLDVIAAVKSNPPVIVKNKSQKYHYYNEFSVPKQGVVLDFETTSPIVEYAKVIEISALKFRDGQIVDRFQTLCNPKFKIPKQVRELTGITDQDVADKPSSFQAIKQLNKFLSDTPVLVGHNVQYDYRVLKYVCDIASIRAWNGNLLCTMRQARDLKLPIQSYDLSTLCDVFGIVNEQPHRAWSDTMATFELMKCIYSSHLV